MKQPMSFADFNRTSFLEGENAAYLENLYENYLRDPNSLDPDWRNYFQQTYHVNGDSTALLHSEIQAALLQQGHERGHLSLGQPAPKSLQSIASIQAKQSQVDALIENYRLLGHLNAKLSPISLCEKLPVPELNLDFYHFTEADLNTEFDAGSLVGDKKRTLKAIIDSLQKIYTSTVGIEYKHIPNSSIKRAACKAAAGPKNLSGFHQ